MKKGRVLIFGGSGFLGSAIAQEFVQRQYSVYILDKVLQSDTSSNVTFIECDITDSDTYSKYLNKNDIILNMAGISDLEECQKDYLRTLEVNVTANLQLLIKSKGSGASRFIFASSMYANSSGLNFYAASKMSAESFIQAFHLQHPNFPIAILRFGSLYGPGSDYRNGIFRILSRAFHNKEIIIEGTPENTRQYIYITDAARACFDITESLESFKTYNVVGNQPISSAQLAQILQEMLNFKGNPKFSKSRFGHYRHSPYRYEITNLDYRAQEFINFESGIIATLEYIKKNKR